MAQKKSAQSKKSGPAKKPAAAKAKAGAGTKAKAQPKKAAVKKAAVKKPAAKGKSAVDQARKIMIDKLTSICGEIEIENVKFLLSQAELIHRNTRARTVTMQRTADASKTSAIASSIPLDKFSVKVKEGDDGSYFMVAINRCQIFFSRDEMKRLVRMCHVSEDAADAGRRMYTWFKKERGDILYNTDIESPADPALATIYNHMIKTYTVKE